MPTTTSTTLEQRIIDPVFPSLKVGLATGIGGSLLGGGVGILRSAHPGLIAAFTGTQSFVLGGSFLYAREVLLRTAYPQRTRRDELLSSTAAGVVSGAAAGAFYGRVNTVVGALFVGAVGHLGQRYVHAKAKKSSTERDKRPLFDRLAGSKWVPFKSISNSQYEEMLSEKLLKIEAEISMVEEKITALRGSETEDYAKRSSGT